jgi:hypothetical protein
MGIFHSDTLNTVKISSWVKIFVLLLQMIIIILFVLFEKAKILIF